MEVRKQLLDKMNDTLDKLIENRHLIKQIISDPCLKVELTALEKTQESLLARLAHLHTYLQEQKKISPKVRLAHPKKRYRSRVQRLSKTKQVATL